MVLNKREERNLKAKQFYKNLPSVNCECGDTVKEFLFANHINSKKHHNKVNGLSRTNQAKIRYENSEDIPCTCGRIVKRYYLLKHLNSTALHRKGRNPLPDEYLAKYGIRHFIKTS